MAKSSKLQAAEHRAQVVDAASKLFRAQGFRATSVPEIMKAADMTHGGFYGHFASKEALAAEALDASFDWLDGWIAQLAFDQKDGKSALVENYLSAAHRDAPALGCPVAAMAGDVSREPAKGPARISFGKGVEKAVEHLLEAGIETDEQTALADYATLVGALLMARATAGRPISDKLLAAARARLTNKR